MIETIVVMVVSISPILGLVAANSVGNLRIFTHVRKSNKALDNSVFAIVFTDRQSVRRNNKAKALTSKVAVAELKELEQVDISLRSVVNASELGSLFRDKAMKIVVGVEKAYTQKLTVEQSHSIDVIAEQLRSSITLFGQLSEIQKDSVVVADELGTQFDILLKAVNNVCVSGDEAVLSLLKANTLFIEGKFGKNQTGLMLEKNV